MQQELGQECWQLQSCCDGLEAWATHLQPQAVLRSTIFRAVLADSSHTTAPSADRLLGGGHTA